MNLSKITLQPGFAPLDADGKILQISSQLTRLKELEVANYCLIFLDIFRQNPEIESIKLIGEIRQEYDDNNFFSDVYLINLQLKDQHSNQVRIYKIDNVLFSTELDWDDEEEAEDGQTIFAWNHDDESLVSDRWDLMYFFDTLGRTTISLDRASVMPFLNKPIDFDEFYKVLVPTN
ncbi:hypothetical protein ICN48_06330 [Polynucleobacter sp. JS-Safj-400b-B2]|uniref:hypothetical protein n=1 Tax=Polynucleobacter sp. JS-Safj-400b-B2 TaxID=2576921 RepID=UPI001C0D0B91|nr:hypothetical protein [Polynucleobacter sp. JS-Safj-400b-B2]MBU3625849.1 hypothetical protein [Polynucleobacter sp. JS-Safj-400b-B2]